MLKFLKKIFVFLILSLSVLKPSPVFASNFITDYQVVYDVQGSGITRADIAISLTNSTVKNFATEYQMFLGFEDIKNLKSADVQGEIKPKLEKTTGGYKVNLPLNRKAVGLKSKNTFKLSFDTGSIARNTGSVRVINIPGISNPADFNTFSVEVKHPASFGKPTYIKPDFGNDSLKFDKEDLGKSGISIGFGEEQNYHFELIYHLKNPNLYPIKTTIALPPDTNYQRVFFQKIAPEPQKITIDKDGNWLAEYSLSPAQKKE
ncbi:MAG TPA: hypothetical protein VNA13_03990, partial [Xanthomonadales bacterium]|nr:hypothetical protein [Xanthomonadales bacterium]